MLKKLYCKALNQYNNTIIVRRVLVDLSFMGYLSKITNEHVATV